MVYIVSILKSLKIMVYPLQEALIVLLNLEKINILIKYFNFANVFLSNSAAKLQDYTNISNYLIDLINGK